jgi:hypothetical protein
MGFPAKRPSSDRLRARLVRGLSRRQMLGRSAAVVGGFAGLGLLDAGSVLARPTSAPGPIPGGFDENFGIVASDPFIHVLPPGIGFEMSTITDLNGVVGASEIRGTAHGSDDTAYDFDTDIRFMRGVYVGLDGRMRQGAFGFV